ncbi:MAG: hypothetical protein A2106_05070 [Planctomycetes bacterium GWF2_40_8]|nr:MAG: hypothetical protein A2106_05070 [Planctomycetes bacterium GWF2_40_8]OHB88220.1 MAG: hypothetical protein A3D13_03935 [Planctomycetes bacterium RIFCSPHIGHO2_02_FULL_40_12]OHC02142.1 MAG: hypothetical protein A3H23_01565 [Planctomycetes bacterium RIFCSPLOWO2_12_FULL_40_19]
MRSKIRLHIQRMVANLFAGSFSSYLNATRGIELDELRQYQPGDEFRSIDWKTTTRTGVLHVRLKLVDKRTNIFFLIDRSGSKKFGSADFTKEDIQSSIISILVQSATEAGNLVSFITFTDRIEKYIPPLSGQKEGMRIVERIMNDKTKGVCTDINCAFKYLNSMHFAPSLVFVLSDFFAPFDYEMSLKALVRKHDIIPIIISDIREEVLPGARGFVAVKDLETRGVKYLDLSKGIMVNSQHLGLFSKLNLDYLTLMTSQNEEQWTKALSDFFDKRARRRSRIKR